MASTMIAAKRPEEVLERIHSHLVRTPSDSRPIVLMTCGIAGSGKTTLSKAILKRHPQFERLSNDEIIASRHGIYGTDYNASKYHEYQDEADGIFLEALQELLKNGESDVIIDRSLYAKEDRDEFKALVEQAGARWVLVYFKVSEDLLWARIVRRREEGINANSALDISRELLGKYVAGFQHPEGEGEIVVEYTA